MIPPNFDSSKLETSTSRLRPHRIFSSSLTAAILRLQHLLDCSNTASPVPARLQQHRVFSFSSTAAALLPPLFIIPSLRFSSSPPPAFHRPLPPLVIEFLSPLPPLFIELPSPLPPLFIAPSLHSSSSFFLPFLRSSSSFLLLSHRFSSLPPAARHRVCFSSPTAFHRSLPPLVIEFASPLPTLFIELPSPSFCTVFDSATNQAMENSTMVPGCSSGRPQSPAMGVGTTAMQAYNAMRGPQNLPAEPEQFLRALNPSAMPVNNGWDAINAPKGSGGLLLPSAPCSLPVLYSVRWLPPCAFFVRWPRPISDSFRL